MDLPAVTSSVPAGRGYVVETLTRVGLHDLVDTAAVATSELVTNAVRFASSRVRLSVLVEPSGSVRLSVEDDDERTPDAGEVALPDDDAENGRGLPIVAALCEQWGVSPRVGGKTVWCVVSGASAL